MLQRSSALKFTLMTGFLAVAVFMQSCSDEALPVDPAPNEDPEDAPLVQFRNFHIDSRVMEDATILLAWRADSTVTPEKRIALYVTDPRQPDWRLHRVLPRTASKLDVALMEFTSEELRFGIGLEYGPIEDSTGILTRDIVELTVIAPRPGTPFLRTRPNVFRWHCTRPPNGRKLLIDCARYGGNWQFLATVPAEQDSLVLENLPFTETVWFRLRFRLQHSTQEIIVDSIPQMLFAIKNVGKGDRIERGKTFTVKTDAGGPGMAYDSPHNILSLSTDGGATWTPIEAHWYVTQAASERCFLRLSNATFSTEHTVGPFSIVDNTTPFFQPFVGMRLQYRYNWSRAQGGVPVEVDSARLTIEIERAETFADRTVYHCALTREQDGSTTTSSGTLTQRHDGLREIIGDFMPYSTFAIPGELHPDAGEFSNSVTIGTPGQIGVKGKYVRAERGRGIVSYGENTATGIITRSGYGFRYTLM